MKKALKKQRPVVRATRHQGTAHTFTIRRSQLIAAAIIASSGMLALAASVPNTFSSGSPAVAADVNANFNALVTALSAAESSITTLQSTVSSLQTSLTTAQTNITALQTSNTALQTSVNALQTSDTALTNKLASVSVLNYNGQPTVRFTGVNVQVVNGLNATASINGTGNLIVGYDEVDTSARTLCSIGMSGGLPLDPAVCTGGTKAASFKTGSHYLVVGSQNNYSNYGGIVAGYQNFSNWNYASVSGGSSNTASGQYASVSGGGGNIASNAGSSVSGGWYNTASGLRASVSGGAINRATGLYASVTGGGQNIASGDSTSVTGGLYNTASGTYASVHGGGAGTQADGNVADTAYSSILGSFGQNTNADYQTIPALP